jgi:DMSO/TMAO reductase YedYZ molybdopterin-dependent catalytic subunit
VDVYGTLECISNEVGGDLISTTLFSGTRLRDVLAKAGPMSGIAEVMFRSLDGYTESIPWDKAEHPDTLLVYGMDGKTLRQEHGYPLRLFNPNHYGMKNPKWLAEIELIPNEYNGYWEVRGWDKEAIVKTTSVTDIKGKLEVVNSLA